jgi:N-methylhydantoinase A
MARAVRAVTVERGRDPREFSLVAFGGNGPLFAAEMAAGLGIGTVVVPPAPGVFSAVGLLEADLEHHSVRTFMRPLDSAIVGAIDDAFATMEEDARGVLGDAAAGGRLELTRFVDLRYTGQSYELTIALPAAGDAAARTQTLVESFAREHDRTYGHASMTDPISLVNLRLTAGVRDREARPPSRMPAAIPASGSRRAFFGRDIGQLEVAVVGRADLGPSARSGPLLIDEYDATTLVPPRASVCLDPHGNIVIDTMEAR